MIRQNVKRFGKIMRPLNDLERGRTQNRVPLLLTALYRPAFRRGSRRCPESVQRIRGLPHQHKTGWYMLRLRWQPWWRRVFLLSVQDSHVGRDRLWTPAPKEQPPRKLSGKWTAWL